MKTKSIATLLTAALTIAFAVPASAAPASKRIGPAFSVGKYTSGTPVVHKAMKRVGPPGKGNVCNR